MRQITTDDIYNLIANIPKDGMFYHLVINYHQLADLVIDEKNNGTCYLVRHSNDTLTIFQMLITIDNRDLPIRAEGYKINPQYLPPDSLVELDVSNRGNANKGQNNAS